MQRIRPTEKTKANATLPINRSCSGFTLVELLVVMAIIATLLSIVAPKYFNSLHRSKETVLRQDLNIMRDAIDKFHADTDSYPGTLVELVEKRYLRNIPVDPLTESAETWIVVSPPGDLDGVYDVRSGSPEQANDGISYEAW
ncbi:type II secretion system protein [Nitrosospira sp. Nsp1]|uniref:type II secretion system protein n=1 Tax=Nitrosospira sp. Nsp1 TaxID=136547 RepID=UPI00087FE952|nr:prepilin-type N-terminal cleavage/methylation domain-containing protein [Nitrosospira sp. Nsp1]SCX38668.1 type II secretion system protein G (GspG) [Nitrosospira sp. Nsp1]